MTQNVVIRGKKAGVEIPVLVDDDGKIETTATLTGDITIGEVEVSNFPESQVVEGTVSVDEVTSVAGGTIDTVTAVTGITNKVNIDTVDTITDITNNVDVELKDEYGWEVEFTPQSEMRVVEPVRLVGAQFGGTSIDSNFWTASAGTGGTVSEANGIVTLSTGTTANNSVSLYSVRTGRYISGATNRYRCNMKVGDTGTTNNTRRWGAFTATDGVFFELAGTTLNIVTRRASSDTAVAQAAWDNPTSFTLDTNQHTYEIYYNNTSAKFVIDGTPVHTISATSAPICTTLSLPVGITNVNSGGGSSNISMYFNNAFISRLGRLSSESTSRFISGANTGTALKLSAGRLKNVVFFSGANGNSVALYDSPSATANQVAELKGQANITISHEFDLPLHNGLYVVTTGSSSLCTIVYE